MDVEEWGNMWKRKGGNIGDDDEQVGVERKGKGRVLPVRLGR